MSLTISLMNRGAMLLAAWVKRKGLTRVAVAEELGITKGYMSQLLTGVRRPSRRMATAIADHTGIAPSEWDARLSKRDKKLSTVNSGRKSGRKMLNVSRA